MPNENSDIFNNKKEDFLAAIGRGAAGAIPFVGTFVGELITNIIPGQRIDRIAKFLDELNKRVTELEVNVQEKMQHPENVDLFEEGCYQACRAVTKERLNYIVNLVTHGIGDDVANYVQNKKMLTILSSLNDMEVLLVLAYSDNPTLGNPGLFGTHPELTPMPAYIGAPKEIIEPALMNSAYKNTLVEKGLIKETFPFVRRGELPEFDTISGKFKSSGYQITPFGRMFAQWVKHDYEEPKE